MIPKLVTSALKHVWQTLEPLQMPMAVMGGIALSVWEHVRATRDVDLLVAIGPAELDRLLHTLYSAGLRPKRDPPVISVGPIRITQLMYEAPDSLIPLQVDLLLADSPYHKAALARRVLARLPDLEFEVYVLTCEDLILHKLIAGRLIDRADAAALLRANRAILDDSYLAYWVTELKLTSELTGVWSEAFPGERPPTGVTPS